MGLGLVIIEKTYNGESWSNTHAFSTGEETELDDADLNAIGFPLVQSGGTDDFGGQGALPSTATFLQAIITFERLLHWNDISFTKVYVTDGKIADLALTNTFAVAAINFGGLASVGTVDPNTIMPGNVALQINRAPFNYSNRQGRMLLRGCLLDNEVRFANRGGVAWTNSEAAAVVQNRVDVAFGNSNIAGFMGASTTSTVRFCIPKYSTSNVLGGARKGQLISAVPIGGLTLVGPVSRQMKRGKKKKVTA